DRDEFVVGVMAQFGEQFLDAVITSAGATEDDEGGLAETTRRFVNAFHAGGYPLMTAHGVRPHQLIQACARSPKIRERYVELIRAGVLRLGQVVHVDQAKRRVRTDVEYEEIAQLLIAIIAGAQTLWDIGVDVDVPRMAKAVLRMLSYA